MSSFACHQFVSPSQKLELVRHHSQKVEKILEWKFYQKRLKKSLEKEFKLEEMKLTLRLTWKRRWKISQFSTHAKCDNSRVIRPFETFSKLIRVKINYCLTRGVKLSNKLNYFSKPPLFEVMDNENGDNGLVTWRQQHPRFTFLRLSVGSSACENSLIGHQHL